MVLNGEKFKTDKRRGVGFGLSSMGPSLSQYICELHHRRQTS